MKTACEKLAAAGMLLALLWNAPAFAASSLADPTRPPPELAGAAADGQTAEDSGPVLQSVLISAGRKSAIIGGQVVGLGEKYGEARVVSISESEVVLKTGETLETLRLFPAVDKRLARQPKQKPSPARQPAGGGKRQ